mgnify:CR=1 FL=1|jgi:hypothetical protein
MKARLLFVNLLLFCCLVSCFAQDVSSKDYNLFMQIRGREITALCVMEVKADSTIVGTVVNEFGVKAFDFSFANGKAKVFNMIAFLDKWYIRKVLRGDFSFILSNIGSGRDAVKKKRRLTVLSNGDICVSNDRYNIHYTFTPMSSKP